MDTKPTVWPAMRTPEAARLIDFLVDTFGFTKTLVVPGKDENDIAHAELTWPGGGGIMLGSGSAGDDALHQQLPTGPISVYVVTDKPDELYDRAVAANAEVLKPTADEDYGNRSFTIRDLAGNVWTFGTYRGA